MTNIGKNLKFIIFSTLSLFFGLWLGTILSNDGKSCDENKYKYINPDLACEDKIIINKKGYFETSLKIQELIDKKEKEGQITYFSLYFRDLQNGPTLGINEHEKFSPASLLKLPVLLAYLNLQIDNPDILNTEIGFDGVSVNLNQFYPPKISAQENTPYKVSDLLDYMIKYSDNNSYNALNTYLQQISPDKDLVQQTFNDLGITDPKDIYDQTLSVKSYASIFIQLYHNSFFPNKDLSEQALEILVNTDFVEGLTQGIPTDITVAHKFGERSHMEGEQLHDCGIVYYPDNPYILCIMTRGPEFFILSQIIGDVSKIIYDEIESRRVN